MKTQERARNLLARRRQQHDNRRASMLGRTGQEVVGRINAIAPLD